MSQSYADILDRLDATERQIVETRQRCAETQSQIDQMLKSIRQRKQLSDHQSHIVEEEQLSDQQSHIAQPVDLSQASPPTTVENNFIEAKKVIILKSSQTEAADTSSGQTSVEKEAASRHVV